MCTYRTEVIEVSGSAKGPAGWFPVTTASVYLDHPVHARPIHTLNIDLLNPARGAAARVALELEAPAARRLAEAIVAALDSAPAGLVEVEPAEARPA